MKIDPGVNVNTKMISNLFGKDLKIANLGLESMAAALETQDIQV